MAKMRTGYVYEAKQWFAQFDYMDESGKRRTIKQEANGATTKAQAELHFEELICNFKERDLRVLGGERVYLEKRWFARFDYTDESGKRRTIRRRAENKTEAKELLRDLLQKHRERGQQLLDGDRMSFNTLADYYEKTYLIAPQYVDGRKVVGLRDWRNCIRLLKVLKEYLANAN